MACYVSASFERLLTVDATITLSVSLGKVREGVFPLSLNLLDAGDLTTSHLNLGLFQRQSRGTETRSGQQ